MLVKGKRARSKMANRGDVNRKKSWRKIDKWRQW